MSSPMKKRGREEAEGKLTEDEEEKVTVTIPQGDDDFDEELWDRPFMAVITKYIHRCDAFVVERASGDFMMVPRDFVAEKKGKNPSITEFKLDAGVKNEKGKVVGEQWVEASVLEELPDGKTVVLQLHDFDPEDWWSGYALVDKNDDAKFRTVVRK